MRDLRKMMRPHLYNPQGYVGAQHSDHLAMSAGIDPADVIRLNANENPYEPLPELADALVGLPIHEYPDQDLVRMRSALSEYTGRPTEQIIAGSGGDEIIELLTKLFVAPGEAMIDCPPTFGMYEFCARISEAEMFPVDRRDDWEIDIDATTVAIERTGAKILFIASPNNPTGNLLPECDARAILDTGIVLCVDETYYEFCGETTAGLLDEYENLVVLRSFSKWAGIAGLRIGYAIGSQLIIDHLMTIKQPYNLNIAAESAGLAALDNKEKLLARIDTLTRERRRVEAVIEDLDRVSYSPSDANFLLIRFDHLSGDEAYELFARRGVFARKFSSRRLENSIRMSVGTSSQNDVVIEALQEMA
jgi:histidinol-phosphate aminotransferase